MSAAECSSFDDDVCGCFGANFGKTCVHCAVMTNLVAETQQCVAIADADELCTATTPAMRKSVATRCSKNFDNLADGQGVDAPFVGEKLIKNLGASFVVDYVSLSLGNGVPISIKVFPEVSIQKENLAHCDTPICNWTLSVPVISSVEFQSAENTTNDISIDNLVIHPVKLQPIDGIFLQTSSVTWSKCSTNCGDGVQYRELPCLMPIYGGLPCTDDSGNVVLSVNQSRSCSRYTDCSTNWSVVAVVGWWQILVIVVLICKKVFDFVVQRKKKKDEERRIARQRFASDFTDSDLDLEESLRQSGFFEPGKMQPISVDDNDEIADDYDNHNSVDNGYELSHQSNSLKLT